MAKNKAPSKLKTGLMWIGITIISLIAFTVLGAWMANNGEMFLKATNFIGQYKTAWFIWRLFLYAIIICLFFATLHLVEKHPDFSQSFPKKKLYRMGIAMAFFTIVVEYSIWTR